MLVRGIYPELAAVRLERSRADSFARGFSGRRPGSPGSPGEQALARAESRLEGGGRGESLVKDLKG